MSPRPAARAIAARCPRGPVALARVTHDRQARECYPAAVRTELRAHAGAIAAKVACVGVAVSSPILIQRGEASRCACEAPQHLSKAAVPYLSYVAAMAGRERRSCRV
ncbi:MAG: hypothetical protein ACLS3M_01660 [Collinsella sp.]